MSINTVTIMGRLTRDPQKSAGGSSTVTKFTVAVDDRFNRDKTHFFDVEAWASTAEFVAKYFHKGNMIAVTGSLQHSTWTGNDGEKKSKVIIRADNVSFCGGKAEEDSKKPLDQLADERKAAADYAIIADDDDLPF